MDLKFSLNDEGRTIIKSVVPTSVDFPTAIDSSFTQINITGNTNENAYLNGIYDASSSTPITLTNIYLTDFSANFRTVGTALSVHRDEFFGRRRRLQQERRSRVL